MAKVAVNNRGILYQVKLNFIIRHKMLYTTSRLKILHVHFLLIMGDMILIVMESTNSFSNWTK